MENFKLEIKTNNGGSESFFDTIADVERDSENIVINYINNSDKENYRTKVIIFNNEMTVNGFSSLNNIMRFSEGQSVSAVANTPYGSINMEVFTHRLIILNEEDFIKIKIEYDIYFSKDPIFVKIEMNLTKIKNNN